MNGAILDDAKESAPPGSTRNGLVDHGRFIAALGIVWFHSQAPGMRVAYIALPFFLVLLAMPSRASLEIRARRLLVPFLQWSALYAIVQTAFSLRHHEMPLNWWHWSMIFTGTSLHLWFLPFAFAISVFAPILRQYCLGSWHPWPRWRSHWLCACSERLKPFHLRNGVSA